MTVTRRDNSKSSFSWRIKNSRNLLLEKDPMPKAGRILTDLAKETVPNSFLMVARRSEKVADRLL